MRFSFQNLPWLGPLHISMHLKHSLKETKFLLEFKTQGSISAQQSCCRAFPEVYPICFGELSLQYAVIAG